MVKQQLDSALRGSVTDLSDKLDALEARYPLDPALAYSYACSALHEINSLARELELAGHSRAEIVMMFARIRRTMASSPLGFHMQNWPSGYHGDFGAVEYIASGVNRAQADTFAFSLEQAMLHSGIVQQHRYKLHCQSEAYLRAFGEHAFRPRILSVGCGGCRDLLPLLCVLRHFEGELVLNDIDAAALVFASERLRPATQHFRTVCANITSVVRLLRQEGRFDLIVAGGLFDYIPDRLLRHVLKGMYRDLLAPGGAMLFTNIDEGNPFRPLMTYAVDWELIERSREAIRALCEESSIPAECVEFEREESQLTWIVRLRK
ncbi:class I SAM-dependent methyltransferase [Terriglobus sp.]|uniref:class I SAM-dependent methyltransferase n=1 Tax=Terriglobus sp. TaxID=1889013 RepID=UPI003B00F520